jgi:signal transduction histidine kinase
VRREDLQQLINGLGDPAERWVAATALAYAVGAEDLLILLEDAEAGVLAPAPGFPPTLPGGPTWGAFLGACRRRGELVTEVAFPTLSESKRVRAYASGAGAVVALVGGSPTVAALELYEHLSLVIQLLKTEQAAAAAEGAAATAAQAHRQAAAVAAVLDQARGRLAHQSTQLQAALTESSRLNEELRSLAATLEARVAKEITERMAAEEQLRQAQKMEAIGQLTGGVAHDFNNLLTVILGGLDQMDRQLAKLPDDNAVARLRRSRDMAQQACQRAATLTSRLLAFARRQALDPKPVDANRMVGGMAELLARTLGEQVQLEVVTAPGLWTAMADPSELESALLNLAVNARDAMPTSGRLTVETGNVFLDEAYVAEIPEPVPPGHYVMIAVSDTGCGMSADTVERVFEPFFTTKPLGQGTGLGLSQVYGFVRQSGGHVRIYSEVGQGTTVKLYLPRAWEVDETAVGAPPHAARADGGDEVILVVEDHDDLRAYSVSVLKELGYRVMEASAGLAALERLDQAAHVDLLFTDVILPGGMDGRGLADEARRRRPGLKVLFTTGYTRNAIVHNGRLDPGVQLVSKPFTFEALARKVRAVLDGGPSMASARQMGLPPETGAEVPV